jgi:hypothetical protein
MPWLELTNPATGAPVLVNFDTVAAFTADSKDGEECTLVVFTNGVGVHYKDKYERVFQRLKKVRETPTKVRVIDDC